MYYIITLYNCLFNNMFWVTWDGQDERNVMAMQKTFHASGKQFRNTPCLHDKTRTGECDYQSRWKEPCSFLNLCELLDGEACGEQIMGL